MKRPAFQFYPADWRSNAKLRRCSEAARGAWLDVLCLLHDSDEYGVIRWPLVEIARAAGVPVRLLKELAEKDVLKGGDKGCPAYVFTPRHAGRDGEPVQLLPTSDLPCWYCSRFIRDEHIRQKRGASTHFSDTNQPQKPAPKPAPKPPFGDGPSSASSSASSPPTVDTPKPPEGDSDKTDRFLEAVWNTGPPQTRLRSSKKQLRDAWQKAKLKPEMREVIRVLRLWANCDAWTKDGGQFAQAIHRWVQHRQWENPPDLQPAGNTNTPKRCL